MLDYIEQFFFDHRKLWYMKWLKMFIMMRNVLHTPITTLQSHNS